MNRDVSGLDLPFTFLYHGIFLRESLLLESYSPERQLLLLNSIVIVTESEEGTMVQLCIAHPSWQILYLLFQLILSGGGRSDNFPCVVVKLYIVSLVVHGSGLNSPGSSESFIKREAQSLSFPWLN